MSSRWLPFIFIAFLAVVIFLFYSVRLRPIELKQLAEQQRIQTISEPTITFVNPSKGAKEPKITIIEFGDFECSACRDVDIALNAVIKKYPNDVRVVWKNLPNESVHEQAIPAAIAAHCADKQGGFWDYYDLLFQRQTFLSDDQYFQIAKELKLDIDRFTTCSQNKDTLPIIQKDYDEGLGLKLIASPTIFVGKEKLVGSVDSQELISIVEQQLSATKIK